jgi:hypothetical protein
MEVHDIRCFQHCDREKNIVCFNVPLICPLCDKDLTKSRLRIPPYIIETPFIMAEHSSCSLVIKPTVGHFLSDFTDSSNLHIGLTDSDGKVHEFDERGITVGDRSWTHCLCVKILDDNDQLEEEWDTSLVKFINDRLWKKEFYQENSHNCYDFVVRFLRHLGLDRHYSCLVDRSIFCEKMIVPVTHRAGKYISLYRQIQKSGLVIQKVGCPG